MAATSLPASSERLWLIVWSIGAGIALALSFSSYFYSTSLQGYFLAKQEELSRADKAIHQPATSFSEDSYQEGYLRGQREAYWDAANRLAWRGIWAVFGAEALLFIYLGSVCYQRFRKKRLAPES